MIAYNPSWLRNLFVRKAAAEAFSRNRMSNEELQGVNNRYPVDFYTPNFFIRAGLFVLTTVIVLFSFGLFILLFLSIIEHVLAGMVIVFSLLSYGTLEYIVRQKKHLRSGVDDALLWISAGALFGGISYLSNAGALANCTIGFAISLYAGLRFGDRAMTVLCYLLLLMIFFFAGVKMGTAAKALMPFIIMFVSIGAILLCKKVKTLEMNLLYSGCLQVLHVSALISFYLAGNYYVVRDLSDSIINQGRSGEIPFAWFFWSFTVLTPCLYLGRSIQKRDSVLLRTGLLLLAAAIFTIKYYYAMAPAEVLMTLGGTALFIVCFALTRYLKTPKYGFTNTETNLSSAATKLAVESVTIAETFAGEQVHPVGTAFGGGSFGGGGASGDF